MNVLVVGGTGTLGRQVVRRLVQDQHTVTCLVRNPSKASFLSEWGAQLRLGSLTQPETLPPAVEGMEAVVDCATLRPTDSLRVKHVDWDGKVALINAARAAQVQQFIFFSLMGAEREWPNVPLMQYKHHIEQYLIQSPMPYTIFRPCGFMQGVIGQYALPILEEQFVWVTPQSLPTAYIDTMDVARFVSQALGHAGALRRVFPLAGPQEWTPQQVIRLCEQLSGQEAKVQTMPLGVLRFARRVTNFFEWSWNIADRLAFVEVLAAQVPMTADMSPVYEVFDLDPKSLTTLEAYLMEYFQKMMKRLRDLKRETKKQPARKRSPVRSQ
ncbi:MAG: NmrA family NAD(P)-binding protein, partial [Thermostichales cyanobacterium BF4_bins_65]